MTREPRIKRRLGWSAAIGFAIATTGCWLYAQDCVRNPEGFSGLGVSSCTSEAVGAAFFIASLFAIPAVWMLSAWRLIERIRAGEPWSEATMGHGGWCALAAPAVCFGLLAIAQSLESHPSGEGGVLVILIPMGAFLISLVFVVLSIPFAVVADRRQVERQGSGTSGTRSPC
jgi:hypothetical protein